MSDHPTLYRTPRDLPHAFEILKLSTIHEYVGPFVDAGLGHQGFAVQKPLVWIRSTQAPIRQMFCYAQFKGGTIAPQWGFSLDFVPHITGLNNRSGRKVRWHKTEKSAMFDVSFTDFAPDLTMKYMHGFAGLREFMEPRICAALGKATACWNEIEAPAQLYDLVEQMWVEKATRRLNSQHHLAFAMCLARSGRERAGRQELNAIVKDWNLEEKAAAELDQAFADALCVNRS